MATWPSTPIAQGHSPIQSMRAAVESQTDGGYWAARATTSRRRRFVDLIWLKLLIHELYRFYSFIEDDLQQGTLTFDWTFPYGHTVTNVGGGTPMTITTGFDHGYLTGDDVFVDVGNGSADGVQTVTRVSATQVSLNGTSGAGGGSGTIAAHFRHARVILPAQTQQWQTPQHTRLPGRDPKDNLGYYQMAARFIER